MIVDESLLPARARVDRRRTRRVDPFESRRSALDRDRRLGFAARIGGSRPRLTPAMPARCLTLLTTVILALGLAACGADNELSTDIPRTSPDLTIPTATTPEPQAAAGASTTDTTTTETSTTPATPPAAVTPQAPPPATPQGSSTTGGAAPTGQSTTGGATAGGGEFENFCAQNPGAC
jgi:hypothetical protein